MTRDWVLVSLLVCTMLGPGVEAEEEENGWVSLQRPVLELQEIGERCPLRLELPIPSDLEVGGRTRMVGSVARYIHCKGVRIEWVELEVKRGRAKGLDLVASAHVKAPDGPESSSRIDYELVDGDDSIESEIQYLELDEGELNWGDGVRFRLPGSPDFGVYRLRIQLKTPADR